MYDRLADLLKLCLCVKDKTGIDVFFKLHAHVGTVEIDIYSPKWIRPKKDNDGNYIIGSDNKCCSFYIDIREKSFDKEMVAAETCLKELIDDVYT